MSCKFAFHYIKISSHGLMIKHEQFDVNHSTKHIFTQKYILLTLFLGIVKPSVTIPRKSPIIGSLCEPGFHGHSRPFSYQAYILMHNFNTSSPLNFRTVTDSKKISKKFQQFIPSFGTDQRPLTASFSSNIDKVLKEGIKPK